ncbi:hypothetical protein [Streptomyces sp. ISL-100]|uniref:hypothetical protein n=1 Tax=Streptomyces sp. ISL-100 TaxID=2819173 RepID=UPI001BE88E1B|nr:hypothetical protein [Streptomyces sp. ISL-100]MBT2396277.1 hypothetical protein [Streptomyces sp. ISL-100]
MDINYYPLRWVPGVSVFFQSPDNGDGVKIRSWHTVGLPVRLSAVLVVQSRDEYYGPAGGRPPGLWKRVVRAVIDGNGFSRWGYCPEMPPVVRGVELSVPRITLDLTYATRRDDQDVDEHHSEPCPGCVAAGSRAPERAT